MADDNGAGGSGAGTVNEGAAGAQDAGKQAAEHAAEVRRLNGEAARLRVERNDALRRGHAYSTMLRAHNISTDAVTADALSGLEIEGGAVKGTFSYKPPTPTAPAGKQPAGGRPPGTVGGVTREDLARMSADEISRLNWERDVVPALRG